MIDTGGWDVEADELGESIRRQSEQAVAEADLVLLVVDVQAGVTPDDRRLLKRIRQLNPRVWLVANKVDTQDWLAESQRPEMFQLGLDLPYPVSAATGLGTGDLLDAIVNELTGRARPLDLVEAPRPLRLAFIGRTNVGKSSIVNAILGQERVIVSPQPHTTREPQDTLIKYQDRDVLLVDTAGLRQLSKLKTELETAAFERNRQALEDCDVAFLVFDATEDPTSQDRHLAGLLEETSKGVILVANKWDLIEDKGTHTTEDYERFVRQLFPFLEWAPVIFVSAVRKQRTAKLLELALLVEAERHRRIDYNALNKLLKTCIKAMKPLQSYGPKSPRIYDASQTGEAPPTFLITVIGEKDNLHRNWLRFFEKRLRQKFGFEGTPIVVKARNLPPSKSGHKKNVHGPGMEAVAGKIVEKRTVNLTRKRQKGR